MKKLMILAVSLLSAMNMMAQTVELSIGDFDINAGEKATVSLNLTNSVDNICAFQCEVVFPKGMSIALNKKSKPDVKLNEDRIDDHTLTVSQLESGAYKFLCYSNTNAPFYENSGEIVSIVVEADASYSGASLTGTVQNQVITDVEANQYSPADATFTGIKQMELSNDKPATIYDLKGNVVRKNATTTNGLRSGVYIINNKKVIVK
ncbi:MAG: hypothetical protein J6Y46_01175 [Prevotella sp.]|nr:hypothetical protein [Prevotella sp.]